MHKLKLIVAISVLVIGVLLLAYINVSDNKEIIATKYLKSPGCHVQTNDCEININGSKLIISFDNNIYYLKPFSFSVLSEINLSIKSITMDFRMKNMEMGVNRFSMTNATSDNKQYWQGKALLPVCITGRADWYAEMSIQLENIRYIVNLPLNIEKQ